MNCKNGDSDNFDKYEYLDETLHFLDEEEDEELVQDIINQVIDEHEKEQDDKISHTTKCDNIELISWNSMPISMRVKDFCSKCEFLCEQGKQLIQLNNIRKRGQKE